VDLRIDEAKNIAYIALSGQLTERVILDAFDAAVTSEQYNKGIGRLWDFTNADLSSLKSDAIRRMAQYSIGFPPGINDVKVAFVAGRPLEFGLSRMFEAFSTEANTKIAVFRSVDAAEEWIMA
jgi:hypothetical protein